MTYKQVYKYSEIHDKILTAVGIIADPIRETMSPKGRNVLFENDKGAIISTNDGATLAKYISVSDPVLNAIIEVIKGASLKSNSEVGDGTSTTILLSSILIREGLKLIEDGHNAMDIKRELDSFSVKLIDKLKKEAITIKNDNDLFNIATISANNDKSIAKDTVKAIKTAGLDGMIFIEPNTNQDTEIIEDIGFYINSGMFDKDLKTEQNKLTAIHLDVPVLITDKRLYYKEEVQTILSTLVQQGYKSVVVVAKDFIGESLNEFAINHRNNIIKCLLVKAPMGSNNDNLLDDLAVYLGGKVVSEKAGKLVNNLSIKDFCFASRAFSDMTKTLITPKVLNNKLKTDRIKVLKKELEKDKDNEELKTRISALTNGMVTIKIGGRTPIEVNERIFRFEDAINATRAAMRDGYLIGGGLSILKAYNSIKKDIITKTPEFGTMFKKYAEGNMRQIIENCGKHVETIMSDIEICTELNMKNAGYNALNDNVEDLLMAGVVDPYKVTENAILNSISVASQILSSGWLIINEVDKEDK